MNEKRGDLGEREEDKQAMKAILVFVTKKFNSKMM